MSRRVLKWVVPIDDQWHPVGSGPAVLVDVQHAGAVTVWTIEVEDPDLVLAARVFGTGQPPPEDVEHLGSRKDGPMVWHTFRSTSAKPTRPNLAGLVDLS